MTAIFAKLNTKPVRSAVYHPQMDGQSERTNQAVKNAHRNLLATHPGEGRISILPFLQGGLNNSGSTTTS